jgi:aconitate hydratase
MPCRPLTVRPGPDMRSSGENYGQDSSREHAALAQRYPGLRLVTARSFARIHLQSLGNYGVLPLPFKRPEDSKELKQGNELHLSGLQQARREGGKTKVACDTNAVPHLDCELTRRQREIVLSGGLVNWASR